jgi:class 3 adenylate cyclase/tetratricopeptide (TPR) repeat protein
VIACRSCGQPNPDGFVFCGSCGAALDSGSNVAPHAVRKTVTVLFADVAGSTQMGSHIDPESMRRLLSRHFAAMREILERHGGTVEKFVGDAVMAIFGVPIVHEDDALRAVRAAAEMRDAVTALNAAAGDGRPAITLRTGVNTGEVVAGDPSSGETLVTGDAVNMAARLEQSATPGEILLGKLTWQLVRGAVTATPSGPYAAKGKDVPVTAYRLESVGTLTEGRTRHLESALVGRERELRALRRSFEDSQADERCHLVTVLGPAGIGKTRLIAELLGTSAAGARVLRGRCLSYGKGITLWPLREQLVEAADIAEADLEAATGRLSDFARSLVGSVAEGDRIASALGRGIGLNSESIEREELFWAVRRTFEGLAEAHPLVAVFDDLHWAEPTLLDLVESLADMMREAPVLLVCSARPEFLELRPNWGGGKLNSTTMLLEPLPTADMRRLIDGLVGEMALPEKLHSRLIDAAEGLPLYAEEIVGMIRDGGLALRDSDDSVAAGDLPVPPSVQAIVAARLDRLSAAERAVVEPAAVIGRNFTVDAVIALSPPEFRPGVPVHLASLVRKELIRPDRTATGNGYRFRNLMMRDTVYASMPKESRATLHARFAESLLAAEADRAPEFAEIIGYHFEQARDYRRQLDADDAELKPLADRAASALAVAGRRAYGRHDDSAAFSLLSRATSLLNDSDPARLELELLLAEVWRQRGGLQEAMAQLESVFNRATPAGLVGTSGKAEILGLWLRGSINPRDWRRSVTELTDRLRPQLEDAGDDDGLTLLWGIRLDAAMGTGRVAAAEGAAQKALDHAAVAGDPWQIGRRARATMAELAVVGDEPIAGSLERCAQLLAQGSGDRRLASSVLASIGRLHSMAAEHDVADVATRDAIAVAEELGLLYASALALQAAGFAARMRGDLDGADRHIRSGLDLLIERGDRRAAVGIRLDLAEVLMEAGRTADAKATMSALDDPVEGDDAANKMLRRGIEAIMAAGNGAASTAQSLAETSVEMARATGSPVWLARALGHQAWVAAILGDSAAQQASADEARGLWAAKGAIGCEAHLAAVLDVASRRPLR